MKKVIIDIAKKTIEEKDYTETEVAQAEADAVESKERAEREETARINNAKLKASAKAKLMAGEPMTEEEANLTLHI